MLRSSIIELNRRYKTLLSAWLIFLLNPLSAVVVAFNNHRDSYAKNIIWLFVAYYGYTLVISNEGMDANRYRDFFISMSYISYDLNGLLDLVYQDGSNFLDAAQLFISFFVSRFTGDPRVLFAVFGLIFGYFYSRNIWFLLDRAGGKIKIENLIYIVVFAVVIGFWKINGFRMWTAAQIFFFGFFMYIMDGKKIGVLIASLSLLFHFSFMFPIGMMLLFVILPKRESWFFGFFIITFFLSEIDIQAFTDKVTSILPDVFHTRVEGYTSEAYLESTQFRAETKNWRYDAYRLAIKWASTLLFSVIFFNGSRILKGKENLRNLLCFSLLMFGSVNFFSNVPAMMRFYPITYLFVFSFFFIYLQQAADFRMKKLVLSISLPLLLFYCIGQINTALMTIGIITLLGNPIVAVLSDGNFDQAISEILR